MLPLHHSVSSNNIMEWSPDEHVDEKLFQTLLKHLRDHARIDLVPYYYDVDDDDRVHGFG